VTLARWLEPVEEARNREPRAKLRGINPERLLQIALSVKSVARSDTVAICNSFLEPTQEFEV
jgi:hypothetical protein